MSKLVAAIVIAAIPISAASAKVTSHRHHHSRNHLVPPGATGLYCFNSPDTPATFKGPASICIPQFP